MEYKIKESWSRRKCKRYLEKILYYGEFIAWRVLFHFIFGISLILLLSYQLSYVVSGVTFEKHFFLYFYFLFLLTPQDNILSFYFEVFLRFVPFLLIFGSFILCPAFSFCFILLSAYSFYRFYGERWKLRLNQL